VVFPLVALGLSTLFEGFHWTASALAGVALILIGNLVVLTRWRVERWLAGAIEKTGGRPA
jgi:drug/metabolite transporter (DMT)-like permease